MARLRLLPAVLLLLALVLPATGLAATPASNRGDLQTVIVGLDLGERVPDRVAEELARRLGGQVGFVYSHAFFGFSMQLPARAIPALERDPRISFVEADQMVQVLDVPTGVERIGADDYNAQQPGGAGPSYAVDVDVAIIDTGIANHPDLNVVGGVDCTYVRFGRASCYSRENMDDNGHGTHVAGTVAARSGGGVVGVAPGARLWSVKVLNSNGSGSMSSIIAGIDWVTARAGTIEVANMSLGCQCSSSALDRALDSAANAGVVYTVAAGNEAMNAANFSPAKHPRVIAVSAVADFDGAPGGLGSPTCRTDVDDTLADFSNYGAVVDIAAPGVCITSTWPGGGYATISGTSMASPHVAGAAALYIAANDVPRNSSRWSTVRSGLQSDGWSVPQSDACGFSSGLSAERFLYLGSCGGDTVEPPVNQSPTVTIANPGNGSTVQGTVTVQVTANDTEDSAGSLDVQVRIDSIGWQTAAYDSASGRYQWSWDSTTVADGAHTISARATDSNDATTTATQVSVTVDNPDPVVNQPPSASITSPSGTVSGSVTVGVSGSDPEDAAGTLTVDVRIDGGAWQSAAFNAGSGNYEWSWDTTAVANGAHTIDARASDSGSLTANATQVSVTVDNAPAPVEQASTMHVGDLDGSGARTSYFYWDARVTITVLDANGTPVPDATVSGLWLSRYSSTCRTNSAGECSVSLSRIYYRYRSIDFKVVGISHATLDYNASDNAETSIMVGY